MTITFNGSNIGEICFGADKISEVYKGNTLVWSGVSFSEDPVRFDYTGSVQTYVVPKGVKKLKIDCVGAAGCPNTGGRATKGKGGRVECVLKVNSNQTLYLYVGQEGGDYEAFNGGLKGRNYGGGGASDIRLVPATEGSWYDVAHDSWDGDASLLSRIVVAGAGGTAWSNNSTAYYGGNGGGLVGSNGSDPQGYSGKGGTQTSGGSAGASRAYTGKPGGFGYGGQGEASGYGYGGGSGWYGGGGSAGLGTYVGSGGGGSSYTHPDLCTEVVHTQGYSEASGNGWIVITPTK